MAEQGKVPSSIRKKPRDPEKAAMIRQMVLDKAEKYPWELLGERRLRLPYFWRGPAQAGQDSEAKNNHTSTKSHK